MLVIKYKIIILFLLFFSSLGVAETVQQHTIDELFKKLSKTKDEVGAQIIEKKIWDAWHNHPGDVNLTNKLELGIELMQYGDYRFALHIFNNIITSDPHWSEAWNKRATLLFFMKDYEGSLNDIEKVLDIEPRHFGALLGRSQIFIKIEEYQKAIDTLKKVNKINPMIKNDTLIFKLEKLIIGLNI